MQRCYLLYNLLLHSWQMEQERDGCREQQNQACINLRVTVLYHNIKTTKNMVFIQILGSFGLRLGFYFKSIT